MNVCLYDFRKARRPLREAFRQGRWEGLAVYSFECGEIREKGRAAHPHSGRFVSILPRAIENGVTAEPKMNEDGINRVLYGIVENERCLI